MNKPVAFEGAEDKPGMMRSLGKPALKKKAKKKAKKEGKGHPAKKGGQDKSGDKPEKKGMPFKKKGKKAGKKREVCPECGAEMEHGMCEECSGEEEFESEGIAKDIFSGFKGQKREY